MNQTESLADEAGGLYNNSDFYVIPGSAVAVDASGVSITKSVTTSHQSCYPFLSNLGLRKQSLLVRFHRIQTRIITRIKLRDYCRCVYIQKAQNDGTFYSKLNITLDKYNTNRTHRMLFVCFWSVLLTDVLYIHIYCTTFWVFGRHVVLILCGTWTCAESFQNRKLIILSAIQRKPINLFAKGFSCIELRTDYLTTVINTATL